MPTAVVSGRVDHRIKQDVDVIIRAAGSTVGNVINDVWQTIAKTGKLPQSPEALEERDKQRSTFDSFKVWFESLPAQNEAYAHMTDDEILAMRLDDYV